jgi:hypothetical protein
MTTTQQQTIERLRLRWHDAPEEARAPVTRLRLERLIGTLDLHPPGMPPGAVLLIQRIDKLPPLRGLTTIPPDWERRLVERLDACYRDAGPPATSSPHAPAVLFSDAAELLIELTHAVVREPIGFLRHWYWRKLLPPAAHRPDLALSRVWSDYARALPAALAHLPHTTARAAVTLLTPVTLAPVAAALSDAFELPHHSVTEHLRLPAPSSAPVSAEANEDSLTSPAIALLNLALDLYRDPARTRAAILGREQGSSIIDASPQSAPTLPSPEPPELAVPTAPAAPVSATPKPLSLAAALPPVARDPIQAETSDTPPPTSIPAPGIIAPTDLTEPTPDPSSPPEPMPVRLKPLALDGVHTRECDQNLWNGFGCVARALLVQHNQNSSPTIFDHTQNPCR